MNKHYINGLSCISAQNNFLQEVNTDHFVQLNGALKKAVYPNFKSYLKPAQSRRMATGIKMGVTAALDALRQVDITLPDAIITGTGMGCNEDTEKFLSALIKNNEQYLTPTSFIQSTHNTLAAQIALLLKCRNYNNTYVNGASSFESALLDGLMLLEQEEAKHILLGGADELGDKLVPAIQHIESHQPTGIKIPFSEGAGFFVVSHQQTPQSYATIKDVMLFNAISENDILTKIEEFLSQNQLQAVDIDLILTGNNGDSFDSYYHSIRDSFNTAAHLEFKKYCGEFYTATTFAFGLACQILKTQIIPTNLVQTQVKKNVIKYALIYNQYKGKQHSVTILSKC